ncbi:hypothetical protein OPV22_010111 [Ensete ventricosum]|uniref:Uncharacterized protein n=1 Tax=Ensete ventricosum TaxID=4639 RepID=A0AAV8RIG5_ENSVE|nr:hypothetical protein OPV22_010111 [Ensete ventricosum]
MSIAALFSKGLHLLTNGSMLKSFPKVITVVGSCSWRVGKTFISIPFSYAFLMPWILSVIPFVGRPSDVHTIECSSCQ